MSILLFTIAAAAASHSVHIQHHGAPVEAVYNARIAVRAKTVGAHTPNRMDSRRCNWTAEVVVERHLANAPSLVRTLAHDRDLTGSHAGACNRDTSDIQQQVARRGDGIKARLAAIAEQDRTQLAAELDSIRAMASN